MDIDEPLPAGALRTRACAKVNLCLHVLGRREDGYHELESIVAFADAADTLTLFPGGVTVLDVHAKSGPTDPGVVGPDNLVLRAARAAAEHLGLTRAGRFVLDKHLPVAAGIGGGSADAAAALRLIVAAAQADPDDPKLAQAALSIGADVPVCVESVASLVTGIGETITPIEGFPEMFAVLVNPRVPVPTSKVFTALGLEPGKPRNPQAFEALDGATVRDAIACGRNDLQKAAIEICPQIADCLAALEASGAAPARMSGSGATCFGLFDDLRAARHAAVKLAEIQPGWWVKAVTLG
ncbi:4-(cytidine 5'-diphospho)-2-C-methyl-D-erythritol kinase [Tepidamorphus sp. 3E244]|uniref:4-(cytidine 5'-diphospho)-2-C-methyl-D-erythritol kinase n=1 Tax=Tepidamorphus sp. 3E244 TaxID=3385498 RepID=UPI0038FCE734